jgi:N,N-dimethylformamidase
VRASLWKYGWEKRKVADLGRFAAFAPLGDSQTLPDGDISAIGVEWNHKRFELPPDLEARTVIAPEESGLYFIHMTSESGEFFSFPWVVAPKAPKAKIAVLASNICWNAYNDWGGRSNYVAASKLPEKPSVSTTQFSPWAVPTGAMWWNAKEYDPISFDRPEPINLIDAEDVITDPIRRIGSEHLAPGEWRLLGWLERERIEFDFYAETQFDDGIFELDDYEILIINCHPEYWTINMYEKLKEWVYLRGGKLLYLGGNGINCSVDRSGDSMVVQNMDLSDWLPHRAYSGLGALIPSRFGIRHELESNLLGVSLTFAGMGTGAPYQMIDSSHPIFNNVHVANGDLFGHKTLATRCLGGASGHETDKRDAGSPTNVQLLARGINVNEGGSELVTFTTESGGLVISVGSINWPACLPIDDQVSLITKNMIIFALGDSAQNPPHQEK